MRKHQPERDPTRTGAWLAGLLACGAALLLGGACGGPKPKAAPTSASDAGVHVSDSQAGVDGQAEDGLADDSPQHDASRATESWPLPPPTQLGATRKAKLKLPKTYDGTHALPVVFLLGGYDYLSADLDDWIDLSGRVDSRGFALVMPDGKIDSDGSPYWNATPSCCDYDDTKVDDAGWLLGLLDELATKVHIDPQRVILVGHSAGGFMAYRLACDAAQRFSAVVSIAGSGFVDASLCKATQPLSVLQVHGVDDDVMPYDGDEGIPGAVGITARWGARAGCAAASWAETGVTLEHADDEKANETAEWTFMKGCKTGVEVRLWRMAGADHYPEFWPVFTDNMLGWALAQRRQ